MSDELNRRLAIAVEAARARPGEAFDFQAVRRQVLAELSDAELVEQITSGLAGNPGAKQALAVLLGRLGQVLAGLVVRVGNVELALQDVRVVEESRLWAPDRGASQTG